MTHPILSFSEVYSALKKLRSNTAVATNFPNQVKQINKILDNDKTGRVSTIYDFMVHSATVPMKIETGNETLNTVLNKWQTKVLNRNANIGIQSGLRALSTENFRERWSSSLLGLTVQWGEEDFGGNIGKWTLPKRMWFLNEAAIETEKNTSIDARKFYLKMDKNKREELKQGVNKTVYIRRPFTALHKDTVVPYFTQRGTVFNALLKSAIVQKQSDVIESLIPLILKLQAGSDELTAQGMAPTKEQFVELKKQITDAYDRYRASGDFSDLIASLRHDVNLDYLIPDLTKIFSTTIVASVDKDLLASLGMIELQGFGTRQEGLLNPKVMIEEVFDAVKDWSDLLNEVMLDMLQRNKGKHPQLADSEIKVIPGIIQAFLTDEMRAMIRSMYDRGDVSRQDGVEQTTGLDFETQVQRIIKEKARGLDKTCKPPIIQNMEQYDEPTNDNNNMEDQGKKPGSPEADNFNNAILKNYKSILEAKKNTLVKCTGCNLVFDYASVPEKRMGSVLCPGCGKEILQDGKLVAKLSNPNTATVDEIATPYENIDALPTDLKEILPTGAQIIWTKEFNDNLKVSVNIEKASLSAWAKVEEKYETVDEGKFVKKVTVEQYKDRMSAATFKFFEEVFASTLVNSKTTENAIETALAITEKVSTKNKDGVLVKNKTITKAQLKKLDDSNVVDALLNLELKEKKLDLLTKLLKTEEE